mgnify:CR=1 FL=1
MIKITIPDLTSKIKMDQYHITKLDDIMAIYFLYDESDTLLYVGKTKNLRLRLKMHHKGEVANNTSHFSKDIDYFKYFIPENEMNMDIYETYIINTMNPKYNVTKRFDINPYVIKEIKKQRRVKVRRDKITIEHINKIKLIPTNIDMLNYNISRLFSEDIKNDFPSFYNTVNRYHKIIKMIFKK